MSFNKLFEDFAKIPQEVEKAQTRTAKQIAIEEAITKFDPDFMEAHDLLSALMVSLEYRYERDISDIAHEVKQLQEALLEADATQEREQDEMTLAKWEQEKQREEEEMLAKWEKEKA